MGGGRVAINYFIISEEDFLVDEKIKQLLEKHGSGESDWSYERLRDWAETRDKLLNVPMFAGARVFLLDYEDLTKTADPGQVGRLLAEHENVLLIYARQRPDKRTRLYKELLKQVQLIEISAPKGKELVQWLSQQGLKLGATKFSAGAAEKLIYRAGTNMLALENELRKLISYSPEISEDNIAALAVPTLQTSIFALVDSMVEGQVAQAQLHAEKLLRTGAEAPYILFMLGRQYRLLFQYTFYQSRGMSPGRIEQLLPAMHPYAFQKLSRQAARLDPKQCAAGLRAVAEADYGYKTGLWRAAEILQVLPVKMAKK